jgi:hypothetical protein
VTCTEGGFTSGRAVRSKIVEEKTQGLDIIVTDLQCIEGVQKILVGGKRMRTFVKEMAGTKMQSI